VAPSMLYLLGLCPVSMVTAVPVFLLDSVHENVVLWAGNPFSHSGCIVGVAWSGFCILEMRRLSVWRRGANVVQEASRLALCV
jgi:hypothetical protein